MILLQKNSAFSGYTFDLDDTLYDNNGTCGPPSQPLRLELHQAFPETTNIAKKWMGHQYRVNAISIQPQTEEWRWVEYVNTCLRQLFSP